MQKLRYNLDQISMKIDDLISHSVDYINKIKNGLLNYKEERKLGLTWSKGYQKDLFLL